MAEKPLRVDEVIEPRSMSIANADALAALKEILSFVRLREEQQTKRAAISAAKQVQVYRIQAAENVLRLYFDSVFAERRQERAGMFDRLDRAMESGDPQMVHQVVRGIVDLAQASPLAGLEDFGKFWAEIGTGDNPVEL